MTPLRWSDEAKRSFEEAIEYIASENPHNAVLVRDRIFNTLDHLNSFSLGLPGPKGYRKLYIPKTSYFVIYSMSPDGEITIITFVHAARDWDRIDWDSLKQ